LGLGVALAFAFWPRLEARTRFVVMLAGSVVFVLLAWLTA